MSDEKLPPWADPKNAPSVWPQTPQIKKRISEAQKVKAAVKVLVSAYRLTDGSSLWLSHRDGRVSLTPVIDGSKR